MKAPCPACGTLVPARNHWPTSVQQPRPYALQALLERLHLTPGQWAARWRVSGRDLKRYMDEGLTEYQADRYASREGLHPGDIWMRWWAA